MNRNLRREWGDGPIHRAAYTATVKSYGERCSGSLLFFKREAPIALQQSPIYGRFERIYGDGASTLRAILACISHPMN